MVCVSLRPLKVQDLELVLAWRSNPRIYRYFRDQSEPLQWDDHVEWFASRDPERRDFIIEHDGRRVGSVAITAAGEVSIYIGEVSLWGSGVATAALTTACERVENDQLTAWIHEENESSQDLFERCGFAFLDEDGDWLEYQFEQPSRNDSG
ncbi:GNAT family N-acetyltransferase [Haloarcula sp. GH36]|uniref:GNAT family N-acetyltransferase n=1 Tax=Haloarcula montana TaxID=3111776 RepID=UPI002D783F2B|nr:GNAT family N-acetyltransferase [Haloarcula sp. GH36]